MERQKTTLLFVGWVVGHVQLYKERDRRSKTKVVLVVAFNYFSMVNYLEPLYLARQRQV